MKKTIHLLITSALITVVSFTTYSQKPSPELLTPSNHALVLIDHESQMAFAVKNIDINECTARPCQLFLNGVRSNTLAVIKIK